MKTMIVTIAAALFAFNVAANNPGKDPGNYCVKSVHGKMVVERNGSAITKEVKFKNGTCIEPNGTVILTDGKKLMLKEGECVNETSVMNLSKHKDSNWNKQTKKDHSYKNHKKDTYKSKNGKKDNDDYRFDEPQK